MKEKTYELKKEFLLEIFEGLNSFNQGWNNISHLPERAELRGKIENLKNILLKSITCYICRKKNEITSSCDFCNYLRMSFKGLPETIFTNKEFMDSCLLFIGNCVYLENRQEDKLVKQNIMLLYRKFIQIYKTKT